MYVYVSVPLQLHSGTTQPHFKKSVVETNKCWYGVGDEINKLNQLNDYCTHTKIDLVNGDDAAEE